MRRVDRPGCSKYGGTEMATMPCINLYTIMTLASALLCSSVLRFS